MTERRNEKKAILWEGIGQRANTCNIRTNSRRRPPPAAASATFVTWHKAAGREGESDRRASQSKWESFHHPSRHRTDKREKEIKYKESGWPLLRLLSLFAVAAISKSEGASPVAPALERPRNFKKDINHLKTYLKSSWGKIQFLTHRLPFPQVRGKETHTVCTKPESYADITEMFSRLTSASALRLNVWSPSLARSLTRSFLGTAGLDGRRNVVVATACLRSRGKSIALLKGDKKLSENCGIFVHLGTKKVCPRNLFLLSDTAGWAAIRHGAECPS